MTLNKFIYGIKLMWTYLKARFILLFHYDRSYFIDGKWFQGGRYGKFTASGWGIIVRDYRVCRKNRVNRDVPWPVTSQIRILKPENIIFHPNDLNNFQGFGNYFQAIGKITIGRGTYIAPNVGLITSNHNLEDLDKHDPPRPIYLGEKCWIGMNSMILPGVTLGPHTIVGAGSVVIDSFEKGNCVIAGNPAKIVKKL